MAIIGRKILNTAGKMVTTHMLDYRKELDAAYTELNERSLDVTLKAKFSPGKSMTGIKVTTDISFVTGKIKDGNAQEISENEPDLFEHQDQVDREERARIRAILFRNFDDLRRSLGLIHVGNHKWIARIDDIRFKRFGTVIRLAA